MSNISRGPTALSMVLCVQFQSGSKCCQQQVLHNGNEALPCTINSQADSLFLRLLLLLYTHTYVYSQIL